MARSPFQGTFQSNIRPTVVMAPDALVYINGENDLVGCPQCRKKFPVSKYVTSIQSNLDIDQVPGSLSISLSIPRHALDDFFFDSNPIITPMLEVEVYAKGYYVLEGLPQYYPIFWGIITDVTEDFAGGETTVTIHCADILKWWELCRMNINPAYTAPAGQMGRSLFGNVMYGTNPYDVIWTLAQQSFGDIIVGTGSLTSRYREQGAQKAAFKSALVDIMVYWEERFSRVRSNLLLYGIGGAVVRGSALHEYYEKAGGVSLEKTFVSQAVRKADGATGSDQLAFNPTDSDVTAFRTQFMQAGQINFWQSEYQTKLELAQAAKNAIGFEFYMDSTGDIVFKPPFYNLDVIANKPISWIQAIDVIEQNFSESEGEVVTQLQMQGNYGGSTDYGLSEETTPFTSVTDYHLLRKYGWRPQPYNSEFMSDPTLMFYHGLDILDRINSKRHKASITIPLRPELRMGFPVYLAHRDQVWYIQGISHNIQFGGRATTTLTLTARRCKWLAPQGIGSLTLTKPASSGKEIDVRVLQKEGTFNLDVGDSALTPPSDVPLGGKNPNDPLLLRHPKTGRLMGYPNAVMVYTRPMSEEVLTAQQQGKKSPGKHVQVKQTPELTEKQYKLEDQENQAILDEVRMRLLEKHNTNRYQYGLTSAGVYTYAHEKAKAIKQFTLINTKNITVSQNGTVVDKKKFLTGASGMVRPVSDERGFEVIGHFRYGRGVSLRDGSLVLNPGNNNAKVDVQAQVALAGGLAETLHAQSQGLTTGSSSYVDPASFLSTLAPEDTQTSAYKTPEGKLGYGNAEKNFVDAAPLGSPEQKGVQTGVEAGQLSRALTLAELTATNLEIDDPDCVCLSGRADLAFISVGYKFKNTNASAVDSDLFNGTSPGQSNLSASSDPNGRPVPASSLNFAGMQGMVERYLTDLYSTLDSQHQYYEESLRGGVNDVQSRLSGNLEAPVDLLAPPTEEYGAFNPPFGSSNRASLGDPIAIAQQGSSAGTDIKNTFESFGKTIKTKTKVTRLQGEIEALAGESQRNQKRLKELQGEYEGSNIASKGDIQKEIDRLNARESVIEQDIQAKQLEISTLLA